MLLQFVNRCVKPDQKGELSWPATTTSTTLSQPARTLIGSLPEYIAICKAVAIGFGVMGFIGYFVKLVGEPLPKYPEHQTYLLHLCLTQLHIPVVKVLMSGA